MSEGPAEEGTGGIIGFHLKTPVEFSTPFKIILRSNVRNSYQIFQGMSLNMVGVFDFQNAHYLGFDLSLCRGCIGGPQLWAGIIYQILHHTRNLDYNIIRWFIHLQVLDQHTVFKNLATDVGFSSPRTLDYLWTHVVTMLWGWIKRLPETALHTTFTFW